MELLFLLVMYVGVTIYLANRESLTGSPELFLRFLLFGLAGMVGFAGLSALMLGFSGDFVDADIAPAVDFRAAVVFAPLCFLAAAFMVNLVQRRDLRVKIRSALIKVDQPVNRHGEPAILYNVDSPVHTTALVLAIAQWIYVLWGFILSGGIAGIAENLATSSLSVFDLVFSAATTVLATLLGVGLFIRRDYVETLRRLGLQYPSADDWRRGIGLGIILFIGAIVLSSIWSLFISPELLEEQTAASNEIFAAFRDSLFGGFMLALTAAVGEEILFRGALQPVFGLIPTSIFFVLLHTQYTLTPATVILLLVTFGFGWLRWRYNTTTAIIAHFVYNFMPFIIFTFASSFADVAL